MVCGQDTVLFHNHCLRPMLDRYFEIHDYDAEATYTAREYTVVSGSAADHVWYHELVQQGAKLLIDAFWEHHVSAELQQQRSAPVLKCKCFFWINEYYNNRSHGYDHYQPCKTYRYLALMPIRQSKPHRRQLLAALAPCLHRMIYSTVDQGRFLPNDQNQTQGSFQRYFDPDWYNSTCFSVVSETVTLSRYQLHVTEKTFKPMAYYHPFVVFGQTGHLAYLHELGFETFENLFDESYDHESDQTARLAKIARNVSEFVPGEYDRLTWQKLNHNHDLFYNQARVDHEFETGIIYPILEHAETR